MLNFMELRMHKWTTLDIWDKTHLHLPNSTNFRSYNFSLMSSSVDMVPIVASSVASYINTLRNHGVVVIVANLITTQG